MKIENRSWMVSQISEPLKEQSAFREKRIYFALLFKEDYFFKDISSLKGLKD